MMSCLIRCLRRFSGIGFLALASAVMAAEPVRIGLDLEISDKTSTSDDAVKLGVSEAVADINRRGGVLSGRPLEIVIKDNRSVPVRGVENLREFAGMSDVVAVIGGKFSPVLLEQTRILPDLQIPLLDPWAAADGIIRNGQKPSWAFRLSLSDSMAVEAVLRHARSRGLKKLGILLPNIAWGRSNKEALDALAPKIGIEVVAVEWYNWGGNANMQQRYQTLRQAGAQAVFLIANEREGSEFVRDVASLPVAQHLPVISHWGVTGGDFFRMCGEDLQRLDFVIVQTFSFGQPRNEKARQLAQKAQALFAVEYMESIPSAVGIGQAYDLTQILAMAINQAQSTDRYAIRHALENLGAYNGVVKAFKRPFSVDVHEALQVSDLFFARYHADGRLSRLAH